MHFDISQRCIAGNQAEFLKLLGEIIFEVDEYIFCVQEDPEDGLDDLTTSLGQILDYLKTIKTEVAEDRHNFSNGNDLNYVPLARNLRHVLPFYAMLDGINNTHHRRYST